MQHQSIIHQAGATLVEVLVAIGLAGIMLPALAAAIISANDARPTATQQLVATGILQQLITATRAARDQAWTNIATDGTYHPAISGNDWTLASGTETNGNFTESVTISDVNRDSNGNIVAGGGTIDPSTKEVVASVSWNTPTSSAVSSTLYLSRWGNETSWSQSSQADFSGDTLTDTEATSTDGGEVQLSSGQTSGTIESSTFDTGSVVGFNYLSFNDSTPADTTIEFQIASNSDDAAWNFVGPDGTSGTYYTSPGMIPLSIASGRYIRFLATLSTTNGTSPILNNVTVNYSL